MRNFPIAMLTLAASLGWALTAPATAYGYGREGHRAVAELAQTLLNAKATSAIRKILGSDDLAAVSVWADDLKGARRHEGPLSDDLEARAFNARFPHNDLWHFMDLPLGTRDYRDGGEFSRSDDIVHEINECIGILEAPQGRFTKSQALRLLIHLVADIHQPLHVGSGYYDFSGPTPVLIESPEKARGKLNDKGGNDLRYGKSHFDELHGYWDVRLVEAVAHTEDDHKLATALESRLAATKIQPNSGDYHHWAEQWATASVHQARRAYRGIVFGRASFGPKGKLKFIRIRLAENYEKDQLGRAADQLTRAGAHLAFLLNRIRWAPGRATARKPR